MRLKQNRRLGKCGSFTDLEKLRNSGMKFKGSGWILRKAANNYGELISGWWENRDFEE